MKICFLTTNIFTLGGVQRVVSVIANELNKKHEVDIICTKDFNNLNRELYDLDKNIHVYTETKIFENNFLLKCTYKLIKELNKRSNLITNNIEDLLEEVYIPKKVKSRAVRYFNDKNYDVIIGVQGSYSLLLGSIKDKISAKVIGWQHNSYEAYLENKARYHWNQDFLFNKYIPKLDEYIVLTNHDKEMYKEKKNINCRVIYNPRSFDSNEKAKGDKKTFLAAGRFTYQKGFDLLLESFKLFVEKDNEWNLILVGEGEEKDNLIKKIKEYNIEDRVKIHPFTDNIKDYFLKSSILLLSSRWEGMPMIVLESLEMGVPIISYDISASRQLIEDGKEGVLIEKYDTNKFFEAMIDLSSSQDKRGEFAKNAILKSEEFSIDKIIKEWEKIIK